MGLYSPFSRRFANHLLRGDLQLLLALRLGGLHLQHPHLTAGPTMSRQALLGQSAAELTIYCSGQRYCLPIPVDRQRNRFLGVSELFRTLSKFLQGIQLVDNQLCWSVTSYYLPVLQTLKYTRDGLAADVKHDSDFHVRRRVVYN